MRSGLLLPLTFLIVPLLEIAGFILVGRLIGVPLTLALVLGTALLGIALLRGQGLWLLGQIRREIAAGRLPGEKLAESAMLVIAGVLLIVPGFVTDIVGLLLFIPPIRRGVWQLLARRFSRRGGPPTGRPDIVDLDPSDYRRNNPGSPWISDQR